MGLVRNAISRAKWTAFHAIERANIRASAFEPAPFLDTDDFSWTREVEAFYPAIRSELMAVRGSVDIPNFQDISPDQAALTEGDDWKTFFLYGLGVPRPVNLALCPETDAALQRIPGMQTAMFSILAPGKHLPPHRGPYNGVLRYHLAVDIPDEAACGIRVGDQTRHWEEGKSLLFDDAYDHEAWNDSDQPRAVLFVDIERPLRFPMRQLNRLAIRAYSRTRFFRDALARIDAIDAQRT